MQSALGSVRLTTVRAADSVCTSQCSAVLVIGSPVGVLASGLVGVLELCKCDASPLSPTLVPPFTNVLCSHALRGVIDTLLQRTSESGRPTRRR